MASRVWRLCTVRTETQARLARTARDTTARSPPRSADLQLPLRLRQQKPAMKPAAVWKDGRGGPGVPPMMYPVAIGRAAGRWRRGESEPGGRGLSLLAGCIHSDRQALCSL
jgi:hypothetical protein